MISSKQLVVRVRTVTYVSQTFEFRPHKMVRQTFERINEVVDDWLDMRALAHSMSEDYYAKRREHDRIVNKANVFAIGLSLAVYEGAEVREE